MCVCVRACALFFSKKIGTNFIPSESLVCYSFLSGPFIKLMNFNRLKIALGVGGICHSHLQKGISK